MVWNDVRSMEHHVASWRDPGHSDLASEDDQRSLRVSNIPPPSQRESAEREDTLTTLIYPENLPATDAWRTVQNEIRRRVIMTDAHPDWTVGDNEDLSQCTLKFVGGADVSYKGIRAVAALTVMNIQSMEVVEERIKYGAVDIDYIPGYLGFREAPLIVELLQDLKVQRPEVYPQLLVVDGNGRFHPRRCGLACHIGVLVDIPAFGVAKKCMRVDRYNRHIIQDLSDKYLYEKDSFLYLRSRENTELLGALYRPSARSKKPVIISVGHRVSLDTCVALMPKLCSSRICQPIRHADRLSRAALAKTASLKKSFLPCKQQKKR